MARQNNRFTVYDMMEAKGVFEANSANPGSRADDGTPLYNGPVEFPMMVYHPMGKTRVLVPGMVEVTPWGPQVNGELKEIIHKVVGSKAELTAALAEGWHRHPAHAISAGGGEAPQISADTRIADLEAKIAQLEAERKATLELQLPLRAAEERPDFSKPAAPAPLAKKA